MIVFRLIAESRVLSVIAAPPSLITINYANLCSSFYDGGIVIFVIAVPAMLPMLFNFTADLDQPLEFESVQTHSLGSYAWLAARGGPRYADPTLVR